MCGRYALTEPDDIAERFDVEPPKQTVKPNFNAAPGQFMPVITEAEGVRSLEIMKWGLVPVWAKDEKMGYKLINARAETLFAKNMWKSAVTKRRCLIPATSFYEWKGESGDKVPFAIHPSDIDLFAFAGVWESWHSPAGETLHSYSIITTEPNNEMASIHNRMPVILQKDEENKWLNAGQDQSAIESFLHPYHDDGLEIYEVSRDVNSVRNNDGHLVLPINSK
jgi:putative SOS response-associated peptidase YedK